MGRVFRIGAIGCGGLVALLVVFVVIAAVVGGNGSGPKGSGGQAQKPQPGGQGKDAPKQNTPAKKPAPKKKETKPEKKPQELIAFSGSDIRNSAPFNVGGGPVKVDYSYDCSSFGQKGNFIASMVSGNPSSLDSDYQQIANKLGNGGTDSTILYPASPGKPYHIEVNSTCSWSIKVTQ